MIKSFLLKKVFCSITALFLLGLCTPYIAFAQEEQQAVNPNNNILTADSLKKEVLDDMPNLEKDTTIIIDKTTVLSNEIEEEGTPSAKVIGRKNPNKALLWSLLPGAGHVYNEQYIKAPIYAGGIAILGTFTIKRRLDYQRHYNSYIGTLNNLASGIEDNTDLYALRKKKRNALRDYNRLLGFTIALYSINSIDAYLNAHIVNENVSHSPLKAAYRSTIFPGWGQVYNKQTLKVPFIWAGLGAAGGYFYYSYYNYRNYTDAYLAKNRPGYAEEMPALASSENNALLSGRQRNRKNMEIAILLGTAWYLLNIMDATVYAHLHDFDDDDDLSFRLTPYIIPNDLLLLDDATAITTTSTTTTNTFTSGFRLRMTF